MMGRGTPWLVALLCAMAGGGIWAARYGANKAAEPGTSPEEMVRRAVTQGRHVALQGTKEVDGEGIGKVQAQVVSSSDGRLRIEYVSKSLQGVKIWDDGERVYRFNPRLNRLTMARKHRSPEDHDRLAEQLSQNYDARLVAHQKVAGQHTEVIELHPRRRTGRGSASSGSRAAPAGTGERWERLWIDPRTWVILAKEDLTGRDKVVGSTKYTSVTYL